MSHVATIDIEIRDLDILERACRRLGLELVRGQHNYRWFGESVGAFPLPAGFEKHELGTCEHAIKVPDEIALKIARRPENLNGTSRQLPYEIGVAKRRDGRPGWTLLCDFFAGGYGLEEFCGTGAGELKKAYAAEAAIQKARQQGFRVREERLATGQIRLRLSR